MHLSPTIMQFMLTWFLSYIHTMYLMINTGHFTDFFFFTKDASITRPSDTFKSHSQKFFF